MAVDAPASSGLPPDTLFAGSSSTWTARSTWGRPAPRRARGACPRARGGAHIFVSNNPTHAREDYADKLTRLGVPTSIDDVLTSSLVLVDFLKRRMPGARLFVVGEEPLCTELRRGGFALTEQAHTSMR